MTEERAYELVFIINGGIEEENVPAVVERISQQINDLGGEVVQVDSWGRRRLAYPIRRIKEGYYTVMQLQMPPGIMPNIKNSLQLTEEVIRHLLVRTEERQPRALAVEETSPVDR
ncbi:MAG: 30S ribosomal protein S6 [Anaerolineae bacterium]